MTKFVSDCCEEINKFWEELKGAYDADIERFFTIPKRCWKGESIYKIKTKEDFIFDDCFWDVFHKYNFHICHISWRLRELRFKPCQPVQGKEENSEI